MLKPVLHRRQFTDWEQLGFDTARETRDLEKSKEICGHKLCAYHADLQSEISHIESGVTRKQEHKTALCDQLYGIDDPVNDKAMLKRATVIRILTCLLIGLIVTSIAAHAYRFLLFGLSAVISIALGIFLTVAVAAAGDLAFEKILGASKVLSTFVTIAASCLMLWGVFELAQAGGIAIAKKNGVASESARSYVEETNIEPAPQSQPDVPAESDEQEIALLLSNAITKIFVGADVMLGILLGTIIQRRTDEKYASWKQLHTLEREIAELEKQIKQFVAAFEMTQRECMAGILRFTHAHRTKHAPYFKSGTAALMFVLFAASLRAQSIRRQEAILIDASGSVGAHGTNTELFRDYVVNAKQLLLTEPPSSRVIVSLITTESFGSSRELLKGRTPEAQGVFTDELERARHELAAALMNKAAGASPIAAGTDIIGGLWHVKAILESGASGATPTERELWIFSDMMNETAMFPMPALIAGGTGRMMEQAKLGGMIVPLQGYKVHVMGASTRGLSPQAWLTVKKFWADYFMAAGAELVSYSAECEVQR